MSIEESTYQAMARRIEQLEAELAERNPHALKAKNESAESRIKELESQLAEAKKDQARYYWMQDWLEGRIRGTKEFLTSKTRSDFDTSIDAAIVSIQGSEVKLSAVPAQDPVSENLKNAVATVLEGWTLPDGVRKILETAYFQQPVKQESWLPIETAPKGKKIIVKYKNAYGNERIVFAKYIEKFTEESTCDTECETDYSEDDDTFYLKEGWVELVENWDEFSSVYFDSANIPTGWMPAPLVEV